MKTVAIKQTTLDSCVGDAQLEQVVVTRDGKPVALIVGLENLDEDDLQFAQKRQVLVPHRTAATSENDQPR